MMEMTKETRLLQHDISRAIASLTPDASADTVVQLLDPLLAKRVVENLLINYDS